MIELLNFQYCARMPLCGLVKLSHSVLGYLPQIQEIVLEQSSSCADFLRRLLACKVYQTPLSFDLDTLFEPAQFLNAWFL